MRKRIIRAVLAAGVLAAGSAYFVNLAGGPAAAGIGPITLSDAQRHVISGYHADRMVVDGAHQRLLIADDVAHRILSVRYDGTVAAEAPLPNGTNAADLKLTADSGTLWATVPSAQLIISWNAATLVEVARYPVNVLGLGHLVPAGDKVWFTFNKNYFASLDPVTGEVTRHTLGDGDDSSGSPSQPLIAVNPVNPHELALTYADTLTTLLLYDTAGDLSTPTAHAATGFVGGHNTLEYTADGRMIYVAGNGGVFYTRADDIAGIDGRQITMSQAVGAAASGGWVAAGLPPAAGSSQLRLFPQGEPVAAREYDIPIADEASQLVGLGWEAGGGALFAVTTDQAGAQSLWRIDQPTAQVIPTLSLSGNGSVNAYAFRITLTAHLGTMDQNRTVEIWADPYGADLPPTVIRRGVVDGSGNLSVTYRLTRNTTFSAVFAGDVNYAARTVTSTVYTQVAVSTAVANYYEIKGSYYYVHQTQDPTFVTTMTPYPGRSQQLAFQRYSGSAWVAWKTGTFRLSSTGTYTFTLTGTHEIGVRYRVRAGYLTRVSGDSANSSTYGSWKYFTFTR